MLSIWHVNNTPEARERKLAFEFGEGEAPRFPEDYDLVARVDSNDLDEGYRLTNHIAGPWYSNPEVEVLHRSRSTSMGDVIVVSAPGIDDREYRVARIGFELLIGPRGPHLEVVK